VLCWRSGYLVIIIFPFGLKKTASVKIQSELMGHWIHVLRNYFFSSINDIICKNKKAASTGVSSWAWKWEKYEERIPTCLITTQIKRMGNNSCLGEIQMRNMITALCRGKTAFWQNEGCFFPGDPSTRAWLARTP